MRQGRFEQIDVAEQIYSRPESRFVAEFMGEVNLFDVEGTVDGRLHGHGVEIHINGEAKEFGIALDQGEKGALMVRPEFVRFIRPGETADFIVRGVLREEYVLGSRMQYDVEASNGSLMTVEKLLEDRFSGTLGEQVILGWDADRTHMIRED